MTTEMTTEAYTFLEKVCFYVQEDEIKTKKSIWVPSKLIRIDDGAVSKCYSKPWLTLEEQQIQKEKLIKFNYPINLIESMFIDQNPTKIYIDNSLIEKAEKILEAEIIKHELREELKHY